MNIRRQRRHVIGLLRVADGSADRQPDQEGKQLNFLLGSFA